AAADKARALRHGGVDVRGDKLQLLLVDDGADARAEIARVTALQLLRVRDELLRERLDDAAVDDDALDGHANLTLMHERAERCRVHGALDVGVVEDDQRVLAAELEHAALQQRAGLRGELGADGRRAREADAAHRRIRDELVADVADMLSRKSVGSGKWVEVGARRTVSRQE